MNLPLRSADVTDLKLRQILLRIEDAVAAGNLAEATRLYHEHALAIGLALMSAEIRERFKQKPDGGDN